MKRLWLLAILLLPPGLSGCGCTLVGYEAFEPSTITLGVGETASPPQAITYGCRTREVVEIETWKSNDPAIATIEPKTGVITAISPGRTSMGSANLPDEETRGFYATFTVIVE